MKVGALLLTCVFVFPLLWAIRECHNPLPEYPTFAQSAWYAISKTAECGIQKGLDIAYFMGLSSFKRKGDGQCNPEYKKFTVYFNGQYKPLVEFGPFDVSDVTLKGVLVSIINTVGCVLADDAKCGYHFYKTQGGQSEFQEYIREITGSCGIADVNDRINDIIRDVAKGRKTINTETTFTTSDNSSMFKKLANDIIVHGGVNVVTGVCPFSANPYIMGFMHQVIKFFIDDLIQQKQSQQQLFQTK